MKLQLKRSNVIEGDDAKKPLASQLEYGELAVNYNNEYPSLFIKDSTDAVVKVGGDLSVYQKIDDVLPPVFVCNPIEIDTQSPPASREEGVLWWDTESGILYVWYEDADSKQWVIAVPQANADVPPGTSVGETAPSDPEEGQLWWNSSREDDGGGRLYVYYDGAWVDTSLPGGGGGFTEDQANALYLSKTVNDTAQGAITFRGQTTHEAGVSVTGGFIVQGTTTSGAAAGSGVFAGGYVRQFCNQSDYPEGDINNPQPFQVLSAPTDASAKSVVLSLNASGSAYFKGLTEHEGGVSVTGGTPTSVNYGLSKSSSTLSLSAGGKQFINVFDSTNGYAIQLGADTTFQYPLAGVPNVYHVQAVYTSNQQLAGGITYTNFQSVINSNLGGDQRKNIIEAASVTQTGVGDLVGYYSAIQNSDNPNGKTYSFYAAGNAPNYFAASTYFGTTTDFPGTLNTLSGCHVEVTPGGTSFFVSRTDGSPTMQLNRNTDGSLITLRHNSVDKGYIGVNAANVVIQGLAGGPLILDEGADARNVTSTAAISNASAVVQQLNPVRINDQRFGFTAADLQPVVSEAVTGTADESIIVGTLTDADGVVTTDVAEPEALPYGATWVQTGTRPVYQGVDQTKLIPLLTKALQETIAKNEELEARLAALEGA